MNSYLRNGFNFKLTHSIVFLIFSFNQAFNGQCETRPENVSEDSSSSKSPDVYIHYTKLTEFKDDEEIEVLENRGEHVNKSAELNWQGEELLSEYLNDDSDPEVIVKRLPQINHSQQVTVEYLNPLTVPPGTHIVCNIQIDFCKLSI